MVLSTARDEVLVDTAINGTAPPLASSLGGSIMTRAVTPRNTFGRAGRSGGSAGN